MIYVGAVKRHPYVLIALSGLLVCGAVWGVLGNKAPAENAAPAPIKVAVATVNSTPFTYYLDTIGELEALQEVGVPAEVGGRIVELPVTSGQRVERGQVLVRLNDARQRGERVRLQGELENAKVRLDRARQLASVSAMSKQEAGDAQSQYLTAKGALQALEAEINQLTIRAPFAGTLGIRQVHLGQYVSQGQTLINLVGSQGFYVNFSVPEQALAYLAKDGAVEVALDSLPDQSTTAVITTLDPMLDRSRMINVQARLQQAPEAALPRMFARVRVPRASNQEVLTVPETAVTYSAYGEQMYIVQPGKDRQPPTAHRIAVRTGERRDGQVIVEEGVSPGDRIVVAGQIKLSDGAAIEAVETSVLDPRKTTAQTGSNQ